MIRRVDLGVCPGYDYGGEGATAVALPGAMLGGMPALWFAFEPLLADGWRVILVWDEYFDSAQDHRTWAAERSAAAAAYAGGVDLLIGKSLGVHAVPDAASPAVCLTPALTDPELVRRLRGRRAPTLLVGGTADPMWDGEVARSLSDDVLELDGADHGLARIDQAQQVADAVAAFSGRLRP